MPKYDEIGRRIDLLEDTGSADRAKRINSLHRTVSDLEQQNNQRKLDYGKEINSLSGEQRRMMQRLEMERDEFTTETVQSYNSVLKGLGNTINRLAWGVKHITTETARATKDAIGQYARAVGEDISINKTNTVAMALSGASPIFGYFASKFMETDVFQKTADKIKEKLGNAVSGGFSRLGRMAGIGKKVKYEEEDMPHMQRGGYVKKSGVIKVHAAEVVMPAEKIMKQIDKAKDSAISRQMGTTMGDMSETLTDIQEEITHTQEKTGNIVSTFLQELDKVNKEESEVGDTLQHVVAEIRELKIAMLGVSPRWETALQRTLDKHPFFKSIFRIYKFFNVMMPGAFRWMFGRRSKYASDVIRAGRSQNVFDRIVDVTGLLYTGMMPKMDELIKYVKELTEFTTKKSTTAPETEYEESNYEKIKKFFSEEKKPKKGKGGWAQALFKYVLEQADEGDDIKGQMKKAGIKGFGDFLNPKRLGKKAGITGESIKAQIGIHPKDILERAKGMPQDIQNAIFDLEFRRRGMDKLIKHKGGAKEYLKSKGDIKLSLPDEIAEILSTLPKDKQKEALAKLLGVGAKVGAKLTVGGVKRFFGKTGITKEEAEAEFYKQSVSLLQKIAKAELDREEREGPHSPSMADNISTTTEIGKKEAKRQTKSDEEQVKTLKKTNISIKDVGEGINKAAKSGVQKIGDWLMFGLMFVGRLIGDIISGAFHGLTGLLGGIASAIGIPFPGRRFIGRSLYKMGFKGKGKKILKGGRKKGLGGMAKEAGEDIKGAYGAKGMKGAAGAAGRGVGKVGATAVGRGVSKLWGATKDVGRALKPGVKATGKFGGRMLGRAAGMAGRFIALPAMAAFELLDSGWDAISAIMHPEEFAASRLSAGLGAFLGGKDSGWSGAASGAMKWGTVGAMAGSIFPGVGTAIGGALGAGFGAIVGGLGGKNIAQGVDWLVDGIKLIIGGVWESVKSLWVLIKYSWDHTVGKLIENITEYIEDWMDEGGPVSDFISSSITGISDAWDNVKLGFTEFIGMFVKAWDAIGEFVDKSKAWLVEKLSGLGPVWDWIKDWIIDPAAYGISKIRKGEVASDLESYMRSGEASAEEKKQERQRIRAENRRTAKEGKENRSGKSLMDLANNAARDHRDENQPTIDAANANSAAAREAADKLNKSNTANVVQQTKVLTTSINNNTTNSSSVVNTNDSGSIRAQNERLMYGHMH